jgi:hypothetical protein
MNYPMATGVLLLSVTMATAIPAADLPKGALCALADIQQCDGRNACETVEPDEIAVPRFLRIELSQRVLRGVGPRSRDRVTKIEALDQRGEVIFAHGVDDEIKGERTALGWVIALVPGDGRMRLTVSGQDITFVASGECLVDN